MDIYENFNELVPNDDRDNSIMLSNCGFILLEQNYINEAEKHFKIAAQTFNYNISALIGLLRIYQIKKDNYQSLLVAIKILELDTSNEEAISAYIKIQSINISQNLNESKKQVENIKKIDEIFRTKTQSLFLEIYQKLISNPLTML